MRKKSGIGIIILLVVCLLVMGGCFFFSRYYLEVFPISGQSMEPTINDLDYTLIFKTKKVKKGDVIVAKASYSDIFLIKRVIGLEGDKIKISKDEEGVFHVYCNGEMVSEKKIKEPMNGYSYHEMEVTVPEGKVFYLGDNRNNSGDSHVGYMINVDDIKGVVFLKYKGIKFKFI